MSKLYMVLLDKLPWRDTVKDRWGKDLRMEITEEEWRRIKRFNGSFVGNVSIQENRFKIIHRWYLTSSGGKNVLNGR